MDFAFKIPLTKSSKAETINLNAIKSRIKDKNIITTAEIEGAIKDAMVVLPSAGRLLARAGAMASDRKPGNFNSVNIEDMFAASAAVISLVAASPKFPNHSEKVLFIKEVKPVMLKAQKPMGRHKKIAAMSAPSVPIKSTANLMKPLKYPYIKNDIKTSKKTISNTILAFSPIYNRIFIF